MKSGGAVEGGLPQSIIWAQREAGRIRSILVDTALRSKWDVSGAECPKETEVEIVAAIFRRRSADGAETAAKSQSNFPPSIFTSEWNFGFWPETRRDGDEQQGVER